MKHVEVKESKGVVSADELLNGLKLRTVKAVAEAVDELAKRGLCVSIDNMQAYPAYVTEKQRLEVTASDKKILSEYFADMAKLEPVTREFEYRAFKENDREGINRVVEANLHIVPEIAELYLSSLTADILSDANFALATAAMLYDPDSCGEFTLFAAIYVRYAVINSLLDIETHDKMWEKLSPEEEESIREAAQRTKKRAAAQGIPGVTVSRKLLHRKLGQHSHRDPCASEKSSTGAEHKTDDLSAELQRALLMLNEDEAFVIDRLFGLSGKALSEAAISDILGVTEDRVAELKEQAFKKLRSVQK